MNQFTSFHPDSTDSKNAEGAGVWVGRMFYTYNTSPPHTSVSSNPDLENTFI